MEKTKKYSFVLVAGIIILLLGFFVFINNTTISVQEAQVIGEKAAIPPKTLIPREKWELRQINGEMKPQIFFFGGKPTIAYKFEIYYVDDAQDLAYYGRSVFINAFDGKVIKTEKAPETRY